MSRSSLTQRKCFPTWQYFPGLLTAQYCMWIKDGRVPTLLCSLVPTVSVLVLRSSRHPYLPYLLLHTDKFQIYSTPWLLLPKHKISKLIYQTGQAHFLHIFHLNHCLQDLKCVFWMEVLQSILQRKVLVKCMAIPSRPVLQSSLIWNEGKCECLLLLPSSRLILDVSMFNNSPGLSFELQMTQHCQNSWLQKSLWVSCGNWGRKNGWAQDSFIPVPPEPCRVGQGWTSLWGEAMEGWEGGG